MKIVKNILIILAAILFILIPLPKSDLLLRVHFAEVEGDTCELFYSTGSPNSFNSEQCIQSYIDYERMQVTFRLDSALADQISGLRLDFPGSGTVMCISNITASSAGIIQKQFNPCNFFEDENLLLKNDIPEISLVKPRNRAYLATGTADPFVILSEGLVAQIVDGYSSFRLTRIGICVFAFGVYFLAKKKIM